MPTTRTTKKDKPILVSRPNIQNVKFTVIGTTSLITHKFSDKCQKEISSKQQKAAKQPKAARDPVQEYKDSLYGMGKNKYGIPGASFKQAMVRAAKSADGMTMADAKGSFFVIGDLIEIKKRKPQPRRGGDGDYVRLPNGSASITYRGEFLEGWEVELLIQYNANMVSREQLAGLIEMAGFGVGVGDWRPEKSGTHGMFSLKKGKAA